MNQEFFAQNSILAALPPNEFERLLPHLEGVALTYGTDLYDLGDKIDHVYFVCTGIISLVNTVGTSTIEIGMVGSEGMVGLSLFLGAKTTLGQAIVQGKGSALRIKAADFANACNAGGVLPDLLLRYTRSMLAQVAQSAACHRFHRTKARLARRLLMISDRMRSDDLQSTQDLLAKMLGSRREGVSLAAGWLETNKLVTHVRGRVSIIDRPGLEAAACICYKTLRDEQTSFPVTTDGRS